MSGTERIRRDSERRDVEEQTADVPVADATGRLPADLDDLLDEIDEVLETNAEEFVRSYVQKGGQ